MFFNALYYNYALYYKYTIIFMNMNNNPEAMYIQLNFLN